MKKLFNNIRSIALFLLGVSLSFAACGEKDDIKDLEEPKPAPEEKTEEITYTTIPYSVSVDGGAETRVYISQYDNATLKFDKGDRLYVQSYVMHDDKKIYRCYGTLDLTSGEDTNKATFAGNIVVPEGLVLSEQTIDVKYILISQDDELHIWEDEAKTMLSEEKNSSIHIAKNLTEAVEKYSDISYVSRKHKGLADEITLEQKNSFLYFHLYIPTTYVAFDDVTSIEATIADDGGYWNKRDIQLNTPADFNLPASIYSGNFEFAIPYLLAGEGRTVKSIHLELKAKNGGVISYDVPVAQQGRVVAPGHVYTIDKEVPIPPLSSRSLPGDIGVIDGRWGIVADLGSEGKVAIALYNVGAEEDETKDYELGTRKSYNKFVQDWQYDDWYIPTRRQLNALINNYKDSYDYFCPKDEDGVTHHYARWFIGEHELRIPFEYRGPYEAYQTTYWTYTPDNEFSAGGTNYILDFTETDDFERYPRVLGSKSRETHSAYVRLFHNL